MSRHVHSLDRVQRLEVEATHHYELHLACACGRVDPEPISICGVEVIDGATRCSSCRVAAEKRPDLRARVALRSALEKACSILSDATAIAYDVEGPALRNEIDAVERGVQQVLQGLENRWPL